MASIEFSPEALLPDDLLVEIIARLPIKAIFRCKLVCKFFCRIPSEAHFIHLHHTLSSKNPMVLTEATDTHGPPTFVCVDQCGNHSEFSLDFLGERVRVRASSSGLLCCASSSTRGVYYVCNPMTRQFRLLPRARERNVTRYHPDYEATLVGLAYEPLSGRFNVALAGFYRPFGRRPLDQLVCFLYDSEANSWRRFVYTFYDEFTHMNRHQAVFACGMLHWLTHSCSYLLALDLANEFWRKIGLPDAVAASRKGTRIYLLELEGSVSLVQVSRYWMSIWVLKDHVREDWVMVEKVHLRCILGFSVDAFPISQSRDLIFMATQRRILMFSHRDKVWKQIYTAKENITYPLWFSAHSFRSTLFL